MKKLVIILIFSYFLYSCTSNDKYVQELFLNEKALLNEFVDAAYQDQSLRANQGKLVSIEDLSENTRNKIKKLGLRNVHYVVMESQDCQMVTKYSLEIIYGRDWHLVYKPCGFEYTVPRGHDKNGFIETWGLDDNWMLLVNNDFIG